MLGNDIHIDLPGWSQTRDYEGVKEFEGDGCRMVVDMTGNTINITVRKLQDSPSGNPEITLTDDEIERMKRIGHLHCRSEDREYIVTVEYEGDE